MRWLMTYEAAPGFEAGAQRHGAAHVARLREFHARGVLVAAGPLLEPADGTAHGVFTSREAVEEFVAGDPFVLHGVVARWSARPWRELFSEESG